MFSLLASHLNIILLLQSIILYPSRFARFLFEHAKFQNHVLWLFLNFTNPNKF